MYMYMYMMMYIMYMMYIITTRASSLHNFPNWIFC